MSHWYIHEQLMRERQADLAREAARGKRGGSPRRTHPGRYVRMRALVWAAIAWVRTHHGAPATAVTLRVPAGTTAARPMVVSGAGKPLHAAELLIQRSTTELRARAEDRASAAEAGQSHADTYRSLAQREFDIPPGQVDVIEGDTAVCPEGSGSFISRGAVGVVTSVVEALRTACDQGFAPGVDVTHVHDPSQVYPSGAHLAVVEVDPVGLVPRVLRYIAVEDCGSMLDSDSVEGQVRGGVSMGIGEVLLEEHVYSRTGQSLTASLRHYLAPLASDVPPIEIHHLETPSPTIALGSKGVGEAGTIGAFGSVANAVADALGALGSTLTELPYSPERIFSATQRERLHGRHVRPDP